MGIAEFSHGDSLIHKLDPRAKISVALIFSVVVAVGRSIPASAAALLFPVILTMLARMSMRSVLSRLAVVNGFVLFVWMFLPFTFKGEALGSLGPLTVYREGVLHCVLITLKSNAIVLCAIALLGTSSVFDLVHALGHMGVPDKLVHLFFFCFRYLQVIHEQYVRLLRAMKIRGFKPRTDMHTYRSYAYLVGMLLVRSFHRSERILTAMKCRGFKGKLYILHHYNMKKSDYVLAASGTLYSAMLLVMV